MRLMLTSTLLFCLSFLPALAEQSASGELKEFSIIVENTGASFEIEVGGTAQPENVEIAVENIGEVEVANPRITVNGRFDWYTLESMVAEITEGCDSEKEKAMAIFDFVEKETYWWSFPKERTALEPVRHFNSYGYHICSMAACQFVALCRAAGLQARVYEIWHHTVAEAFWDGAWHHMDPDIGIWYLKDDNLSVASIAELEDHPEWVSRAYKPYRYYYTPGLNHKLIYKPDAWPAGEGLGLIYDTAEDNYVETGYDKWMYEKHTMDITLRPDEKLVRWWKPTLRKYYDQARSHEPPCYANGQLVFEPDFGKRSYEGMIERENAKFSSEDGVSPMVHVDRLQSPRFDRFSRLIIPMASPYVIVGGYIDTRYYKGGTTGLDQVSLSAELDSEFHIRPRLWNYYSWAYAMGDSRAVLDGKMLRDGPRATYGFKAEYHFSANSKHADIPEQYPLVYGGQSGVDKIKIVADLQVNPRSLPALSLGNNKVEYRAETAGKVRLSWKWRETDEQHAPSAPARGSVKDGSAPVFKWNESTDADGDKIICYRFQLSTRRDCAWPLATTFDRDVREGVSFAAPEGWLNKGTSYYWRVRAEDATGRWSDWSDIFGFKKR